MNVIIEGNNVEVRIDEGRAQIKNYWIASIKNRKGARYEIDQFQKSSSFDVEDDNYKYVKLFKNLENGEYIINFHKKGKGRKFLTVKSGKAEIQN